MGSAMSYLLEQVQKDTKILKTEADAGTYGDEYKFPCPLCGGEDRFCVWPNHPKGNGTGKFWCRGCGVEGDGIDYLRKIKKMGYHKARQVLGLSEAAPVKKTTTFHRLANVHNKTLPAVKWIFPEVAWACLDATIYEPGPILWPVILYNLRGEQVKFNSAEELLALVDWDAWEFYPSERQRAWLNTLEKESKNE